MKFRKDGAVGAPEVRCLERLLEHAVTIRIELEVVRLLIAVIVANVERRAGIDPVGEQEVETELLVEFTQGYPKGKIVIYDEVCEEPMGKMEEIFEYVGWTMDETVCNTILETVQGNPDREETSQSYYATRRDPMKSMSKWKHQLTEQQQIEIMSIIDDSPLQGWWPDLKFLGNSSCGSGVRK